MHASQGQHRHDYSRQRKASTGIEKTAKGGATDAAQPNRHLDEAKHSPHGIGKDLQDEYHDIQIDERLADACKCQYA